MKELKSYIFESSNDDSKIVFKKSVFNDFFNNKQFEITVNGEKINIINITFDRKTERGNELFRFNYDMKSQIQVENSDGDFYYQITCEIIKYIFDTIFGENNWNDFFKLGSIDTYKVHGRLEGTSGLYKTLPIKNNDTTQDSICLYYENNEFKTESKSKKAKKSLYIPLNKFNNLYIANQHDAYYGKITIGRKTVTPNKILNINNSIKLNDLKKDNLNIDKEALKTAIQENLDSGLTDAEFNSYFDEKGNFIEYDEILTKLYEEKKAAETAAGDEWDEDEQKGIDEIQERIDKVKEAIE